MDKAKQFSEWMKHVIDCNSYGNTINEQTVALLKDLYFRISQIIQSKPFVSSRRIYEEMLDKIEAALDEYSKGYKKILKSECISITETETEWLRDFMKDMGVALVIPATILANTRFSPVASFSNYEDIVTSTVNRIRQSTITPLKTAYIMKSSTESISEKVLKREEVIEKQVAADGETFNNSVFDMTNYLIFKANSRKVRYIAMLDSRTCEVCASYDGQVFTAKDAPLIPLHENCRCTLCPEELCDDEVPTYSEWFETLEESEKEHILGKGRYELYQQGFGLDRFVNNGRLIPLAELKYTQDPSLVNVSEYIIPEKKIFNYALNPKKSKGKSVVFESALGYNLNNGNELLEELNKNKGSSEFIFQSKDQYGKRYRSDIEITGANGKVCTVRTGWILRDENPKELQLTTLWVL